MIIPCQLYRQLEDELAHLPHDNIVKRTALAIQLCEKYMEEIRLHVMEHPFRSQQEEITFFKEIKPKFLAQLLYYVWLNNVRTVESEDSLSNHYRKELKRIRNFYKRNQVLKRYLKSGATFLDTQLFVRGHTEMSLYLAPEDYCHDRSFGTSHDQVVARFMVYDLITEYIQSQLKEIGNSDNSLLYWTDSKVDAVELIYALHSARAINNGRVELNQISTGIAQIFQVELDDIYRTFKDIKQRDVPTKFLDKLRKRLKDRISTELKNS
jgi:Mg2+ and Co2+ transporter CorA